MLQNAISEGIAIFDRDMRLVQLNDAVTKILGITQGDIGKTMLEIYPPLKNSGRYEKCLEVIRTGKPLVIEDVVLEPKFGKIYLSLNCFKVGDGLGIVFTNFTEMKKIEEEQIKSEEKYRSLVEYTTDWIWEIDENGFYIYSSPKAKLLLGFSSDEIIGKTPFDFMAEEEAKKIGAIFEEIAKLRKPFSNLENTILSKDGKEVIVETSGFPIFDINGNYKGYRGIDRNVTERKQAEKIIRESRDTFLTFSNSSTQTFSIWDSKLNLIDCNKAFHKDFFPNMKREELIGMNMLLLAPDIKTSGRNDKYLEVIKTGIPIRLDDFVSSPIFEEQHLSITAFKVGNGLGLIGDNTTERWQAEKTIRESEEKFCSFFSAIPDAAFVIDQENGDILDVNAAAVKIYGYSRDEWLTMKNTDVSAEPEKTSKATKAPPTQIPIRYHKKKNGTVFPLEMTAVFNKMNERNVVFATGRDISERMKIEEKLKHYSENLEVMVENRTKELNEANKQLIRKEKLAVLGQLSGAIGHELRNPLGVIKNVAYLLKMNIDITDPEIKESLEILEKEVERSEKIITNILNFAQPKPIMSKKTNLNDVVKEALTNVVIPKNIKLMNKLDESLLIILADPDLLTLVFGNLIYNSIQAMPDGGKLTIDSSSAEQDWVTMSITDTGSGIPDDMLDKIFEPLYTTKAKGIGLGLPITKDIVEKHGGSIEVQSKIGKGTTFNIKLPVKCKV